MCGHEVASGKKYCSQECAFEARRRPKRGKSKIDWPPITELIHMAEEVSYAEIGRRLGVSANAVKKHIDKESTRAIDVTEA